MVNETTDVYKMHINNVLRSALTFFQTHYPCYILNKGQRAEVSDVCRLKKGEISQAKHRDQIQDYWL